MSTPCLGYWDIRGLGEPIRLMLEYCGVDYEEKRYPPGDHDAWNKDKFQLGLDFPNVPYYIDGDVRMTDSLAIMKHIARKHGLMPTSETDKRKCENAEGALGDFRVQFGIMCYFPDFENNKLKFLEYLTGKMDTMNKYLEKNKWISGENLCYVDFGLCEWLSQLLLMEPKCLEKCTNVTTYYDNFFKLDKIAAYRKSEKFKKFPINNPIAHWGGKEE